MNASPHHSKVKVSITLSDNVFVAGSFVSGKMEMDCRADRGLALGRLMIEFFGIQELNSRDHSATSTFLHSRRLFQGAGLPPSNAVHAHPLPSQAPLPSDYYHARRGRSSFLFRFPIPQSSPSAINFASGTARVKYELRASVQTYWKSAKQVVTDSCEVDIVETLEDFTRTQPEGVTTGENGKIWVHANVVDGFLVAGKSACVELIVKNHSARRNTNLIATISRSLRLGNLPSQNAPLKISDVLSTVAFRGPEYIIAPGVEGVASLVFDVPNDARGVKGGVRDGDESEARHTEALFEVQCFVGIKIGMGIGSKDIQLDLPLFIAHPLAVPYLPSPYPYVSPNGLAPATHQQQIPLPHSHPNAVSAPHSYPMSPPLLPFLDQGQLWFPAPFPNPQYPYISPHPMNTEYVPPPVRPSSTGPATGVYLLPMRSASPPTTTVEPVVDGEKGKGPRASRIAQHLRYTSRRHSVSPQSHRFPMHIAQPVPQFVGNLDPERTPLTLQAAGIVHSPTPQRSVHLNLPSKAERVEALEQMAAEVAQHSANLSGDLPDSSRNADPSPPVTDVLAVGNEGVDNTLTHTVASGEEGFTPPSDPPQRPPSSNTTPPTPLNAITPLRVPRPEFLLSENGLDALERRLLTDVGTQKMNKVFGSPRSTVLPAPITIPPPNTVPEPLNDSAISSLTLAVEQEAIFDARTERLREPSPEIEESKSTGGGTERHRETDEALGKRPFTKGKGVHRQRKTAYGRVAAWLEGLDQPVPPLDVPPSVIQNRSSHIVESTPEPDFNPPPILENLPPEIIPMEPNPRSSGFVPIGTFKRDSVMPEGARVAPVTTGPYSILAKNKHPTVTSPLSVNVDSDPPSNPLSPPDPEIKYDHKSTRGGRGGRVATLAALWASSAAQKHSESKTARPLQAPSKPFLLADPTTRPERPSIKMEQASSKEPKRLTEMAQPSPVSFSIPTPPPEPRVAHVKGKHTHAGIKSLSVPAVVSSSHAIPVLSSTASLARPPDLARERRIVSKVPPAIRESPESTNARSPPVKSTSAIDLVFGRARLRDLIKKYQGGHI